MRLVYVCVYFSPPRYKHTNIQNVREIALLSRDTRAKVTPPRIICRVRSLYPALNKEAYRAVVYILKNWHDVEQEKKRKKNARRGIAGLFAR